MQHIQGGARFDGAPVRRKGDLRRLVAEDPSQVVFLNTSAYGDKTPITMAQIPEGHYLIVVGPDPYNDRKWYAQVRLNKQTGKVTVS